MHLSDLIRPDRVVVPLQGATLGAAGYQLLERLVATGAIAHPERLWGRAQEERPEDLVAMGERAFLLHYRTTPCASCASRRDRADAGRARELGRRERQSARIILLVVAPPRAAAIYLQRSARSRGCSRARRVPTDARAADAEALAALRALQDIEVRDQLTVRDLMTARPRTCGPTRRCATRRSTWCAPASAGCPSSTTGTA
jgi:hypothetical protein